MEAKERFTIGVDLGGTKAEIALTDQYGNAFSTRRYMTRPENGPDAIIADLVEAVRELQKEAKSVAAVGIGIAGQITRDGMVRSAPNLPFEDEPLQARLEDELRMPVVVTNDVHAAAYGEWKYGAGRGVDDLVVLFVGTGIGGGVVSGGRLFEGCTGSAGELGHITLVVGGRKCRCPNRGCIEAYAGGWAIAERAQKAAKEDPDAGRMLTELAGSFEDISAETVSKAYHQGDEMAKEIVEATGRYLGAGAVGIVNAFNPCLFILGGGVIEGIPELLPIVENHIKRYALKPNKESVNVVKAGLGPMAGVTGAGAFARNIIGEES